MSVFAIRTNLPVETPVGKSLRTLQSMLETALAQVQSGKSSNVQSELLIHALIILNTIRNGMPCGPPYESLASRVATTALSLADTMEKLYLNIFAMDEVQRKGLASLEHNLQAINELLVTISQAATNYVAQRRSSASFWSLRALSPEAGVQMGAKELHRLFHAFSLKLSIFVESGILAARDELDADGELISWGDVDLQVPYPWQRFPSLYTDHFWDGTYHAVIKGRRAIVKTYPSELLKTFEQDLRTMKGLRHANLPSVMGYSKQQSPLAFIAISNELHVPFFDHLPIICERYPGAAIEKTWEMIFTMRATLVYLANLGLVKYQVDLQDLIKTAVVDQAGRVVIAPRVDPHGRKGSYYQALALPLSSLDLHHALKTIYSDRVEGGLVESAIDHLPSLLRPIRYALAAADTIPLPPVHARLESSISTVLHSHCPGAIPLEKRVISWPIAYLRAYEPVVGDIGRFVFNAKGEKVFERLTNVQTEIGGYIATVNNSEREERLSANEWRFPLSMTTRRDWTAHIPVTMCIQALLENAQRLSDEYGISPTDLVIVHHTLNRLRWDHLRSKLTYPDAEQWRRSRELIASLKDYSFLLRLDDQGRLPYYWHPWPHLIPSIPSLPIPPTAHDQSQSMVSLSQPVRCGIQFFRAASSLPLFVQYEQTDFTRSKSLEMLSLPRPSLGDIGSFRTRPDGQRYFHVFCNVVSDMVDFCIQGWERNPSKEIGPGVWRSPPINYKNSTSLRFTWSVSASIRLPTDLAPFYRHFLATNGGREKSLANEHLHMVGTTYHQVRVEFSPQVECQPLYLFVHFSQGLPVRAYWSAFSEPYDSEEPVRPWPGCKTEICMDVLDTPEKRQLVPDSPHSIHDMIYRKAPLGLLESGPKVKQLPQRIAGIGYWIRDLQGHRTGRTLSLGYIDLLNYRTTYSTSSGFGKCEKTSETLWVAHFSKHSQDPNPSWFAAVESHWDQQIPSIPPTVIARLVDPLRCRQDLRPEDVFVVSRVIYRVWASASNEALRESHNSRIPDLHLYAAFPPEGGCYAFWSSRKIDDVDCRALSKLDLEGWQMAGCHVRVTIEIERTPLLDLLDRGSRDSTLRIRGEDDIVARFVAAQ